MRTLALVMWTVAAVWIVLAVLGAENFQELYGGSSGAQVIIVALVIAIIPIGIGWWAYRKGDSNHRHPS